MDEFIELAYASRKWEKWILKNKNYSEKELALISGHYIFSNNEFIELKNKAQVNLKKKGINIDSVLKNSIKKSIMRYLFGFNLV